MTNLKAFKDGFLVETDAKTKEIPLDRIFGFDYLLTIKIYSLCILKRVWFTKDNCRYHTHKFFIFRF